MVCRGAKPGREMQETQETQEMQEMETGSLRLPFTTKD